MLAVELSIGITVAGMIVGKLLDSLSTAVRIRIPRQESASPP